MINRHSLYRIFIVVVLGACSAEGTEPAIPSEPEADTVATKVAHRDPSALVQTDSLVYGFRPNSWGIESIVGFTYRNSLPDTLYIVNCRGFFGTTFQRKRDGVWRHFWTPAVPACLSPPIVIPPGGTLVGSASIYGSPPGLNRFPELPLGDLTDVYRVVFDAVVHHYTTTAGSSFGLPVPLERRVSNEFVLRGGFGSSGPR